MKKYNMTDSEVIKALEYCIADRIECDKCALQRECESNPFCSTIAKYALDLINRQRAEIERLKECPKCVYEYDGEVTEYCVQGPCPNFKTVEQIKTEAYKEFAEKLEEKLCDCRTVSDGEYCGFDCGDTHECIDDLLKEMVDEEK